mgnify:CR=1 FL=1
MRSPQLNDTPIAWTELNFGETEGGDSGPHGLLSLDQVNRAKRYLEYNKDGHSAHQELLKRVASQAALELGEWMKWVNAEAAADEADFLLFFNDSNDFNACVKPRVVNSFYNEYAIIINLGCLPLLISAANRLVNLSHFSPGWIVDIGNFDRNERGWDPRRDPMGNLTFAADDLFVTRTIRTTVDAIILMVLHEVTHGCKGHLMLKASVRKSPPIRRALESEADWGSGYLFVHGTTEQIYGTPGVVDTSFLSRIVIASLCNFIGFQANLIQERTTLSPYYLPYTRLQCALEGVRQAWLDNTERRVDINVALPEIWTKFMFLENDFPEVYTGWIEQHDDRSKADMELHIAQSDVLLAVLHTDLSPRSFAPLKGIVRRHYP